MEEHAVAVELTMKRTHHARQMIPVCQGSREELSTFLDHMDVTAIISYVSGHDWAEAKRLLKGRFGRARRPVHKHVIQILTLQRGRDESASDYAKKTWEETRHLRTRVREAGYLEH